MNIKMDPKFHIQWSSSPSDQTDWSLVTASRQPDYNHPGLRHHHPAGAHPLPGHQDQEAPEQVEDHGSLNEKQNQSVHIDKVLTSCLVIIYSK